MKKPAEQPKTERRCIAVLTLIAPDKSRHIHRRALPGNREDSLDTVADDLEAQWGVGTIAVLNHVDFEYRDLPVRAKATVAQPANQQLEGAA